MYAFCGLCLAEVAYKPIDKGLELALAPLPRPAKTCPGPIVLLRIDMSQWKLVLACRTQHDGAVLTAAQWSRKLSLFAAINASMYLPSLNSTGYMRNFGHVNNSHINPAFGVFLVFNPLDSSQPDFQLLDRRTTANWREILDRYHTAVQNYRMIGPAGQNLWKPSDKRASIAAVGVDDKGALLFIFCASPFSTHDFNEMLLSLPIGLQTVMYVEGGPQATLYYRTNKAKAEWTGVIETEFFTKCKNNAARPLPNVLGIQPRQ